MPEQAPEIDPRAVWRSQPAESMELPLANHRLRQKAEDLQVKNRRELINGIALAALVAAGSIFGCIRFDSPVARILFAASAAWVLIGQFFLHRTRSQTSPLQEAGRRTIVDSFRRELEQQIRLDRGAFLWLQGPLFLAFGTLAGTLVGALGGKGRLVAMAGPVAALLVTWALSMIAFRQSQERKLRRAIDELDQIDRM